LIPVFHGNKLDHLYVIHAGADTFPLSQGMTAVALARLGSVRA
jgi:hypothetical protein